MNQKKKHYYVIRRRAQNNDYTYVNNSLAKKKNICYLYVYMCVEIDW